MGLIFLGGQKDITKRDIFVGFVCQTINWSLDAVNTKEKFDFGFNCF